MQTSMKEYWVNVYNRDSFGNQWATKEQAIAVTDKFVRYRIHVKIDGGYNNSKKLWEQANQKIGYLVWNDEKLKYDKWYKDPSLDQDRYDKPNGKCSHCGMELGQHLMPLTVMKSREEILDWMAKPKQKPICKPALDKNWMDN